MNLNHLTGMLTLGAVRSTVLGSPFRMTLAGVILFMACRSTLAYLGVSESWASGAALSLLVAVSTAIIYARNERHYQQLEAIVRLTSSLAIPGPLPSMRGWKLSPDAAVFLVQHLRGLRARHVVEAGCGASTVLIAAVLKQQGSGSLIALEHDPQQVAECQHLIDILGLDAHATVIHAPLVKHSISGQEWLWYDLSTFFETLPADAPIDLLLVDGPPVWTQALARYPALPLLSSRLRKSDSAIMLDDASRASERRVVQRWKREFPGWKWSHRATEDGLVIGIRSRETAACE